jgi:ATP-dependent DNA helicase UvrD/PcrA
MARLTDPQRAAVDHPSVPLCIVAGAGSGKTSVLTLRVARRILDESAAADHTVVCTFTRKAAGELQDRLRSFGVPVSVTGPGRVPGPGVRAGTLHQLALSLIRRHSLDVGTELPVIVEQRWAILRQVSDGPGAAAVLATEIAWAKARGLTPDGYEAAAAAGGRHVPMPAGDVADGFRAYQAALHRRRALDLDDLLVRAGELLETDDGFAERMRWRYRHLSVDEFQDVNPAQFRLIRALLGGSPDLCVVGDPNQAIYGWNGADPTLLGRLPELLGPITVLELVDNHRSTPQIVALADGALGHQRAYRSHSVLPDGPVPTVAAYEDETAEAEGVADFLAERHDEGVPWSEQAVLARTHDQLSVIARVLARAAIPHRRRPAPEAAPESGGTSGDLDGATTGRRRAAEVEADDLDQGTVDAVELATFHRAKGAEWTSVCVTGVEDGFVPIVYAVDADTRAEERRLLYVALTRPAHNLACSWARLRTMGGGRVVERQPSTWLATTEVGTTGRPAVHPADGAEPVAGHLAGLRSALNPRPGTSEPQDHLAATPPSSVRPARRRPRR